MHDNPGSETDYAENETPTSAANLECIRTRGISIKKNYLGDTINYQDIITQVFEIFFVNPINDQDLGKWIQMINNWDDLGTWQQQINLYGIKINNCRIINEDIPTSSDSMEDAVGRGRIRLEIEQRICGDVSSIENHEHYVGLHSIFNDPEVCPYLDTISEDFSFNYGKGEQVSLTHTVDIKPFDSCPNGLDQIRYQCLDENGAELGTILGGTNFDCVLDECKNNFPDTVSVAAVTAATTNCCTPILSWQTGQGQYTNGDVYSHGGGCWTVTDDALAVTYNDTPPAVDTGWTSCTCCTTTTAAPGTVGGPGSKAPVPICRPGQYNIDKALTLARQILDFHIPDFGLAFNAAQYSNLANKNVLCYYSETQNLITGEASMTKKISLLSEKDAELDWTADYKHSFVMDGNGIVRVTESGKVKGNKKFITGDGKNVSDQAYERTKQGLEEILSDIGAGVVGAPTYAAAAMRCQEVYDIHIGNFTGPFDNWDATKPDFPFLSIQFPLEITKNFNNIGRDVSYSVTFTDDPNMAQGYFASRTLTASRNSSGVVTVVEKSDLTQFTEKGGDPECTGEARSPLWSIYPGDVAGSNARVMAFYNRLEDFTIKDDGCSNPMKLMSQSIGYNPSGRNINYSITYSGDKSISCVYPDANGIRKKETSTDDKLPQRIRKEHPIANWKMLVHDSQQTDLGERKVEIKAELDRVPKDNRLTNPTIPSTSLKHLVSLAEPALKEVFDDNAPDKLAPDDMYIKLCAWSFGSTGAASFAVAINYLQAK